MVRVVIEHRAKVGMGDALDEVVRKLRARATAQSGYISGESMRGYYDSSLILVISTWTGIDYWQRWQQSPEHSMIMSEINQLSVGSPEIAVFSITGKR